MDDCDPKEAEVEGCSPAPGAAASRPDSDLIVNSQPVSDVMQAENFTESVSVGGDLHLANCMNISNQHTYNNPVFRRTVKVQHKHQIHNPIINFQQADDIGGYAQIKDQSEAEINFEVDLFVETVAYRQAEQQLRTSSILVISGPPGCGKSTAGRALLRQLQATQGRTPLVLHHWKEWRMHVGGDRTQVVLIEDAFGKDAFTRNLYEVWSKQFLHMQTFAQASKSVVVLTMRDNVLDEAYDVCGDEDTFMGFPVLHVNQERLTEGEKIQMLINHVNIKGKRLAESVIEDILVGDRSGPIFPLCCKEFAKLGKDSPCQTWIFKFSENERAADNLHIACKFGIAHLVTALIDRGAPVNGQDRAGMTPLHHACANGHVKVVMALLAKNADIEVKDRIWWTPLHHASLHENSHIVSILIKHKAAVNALDRLKRTPLYLACHKGGKSAAEMLVSHGADPDLKSITQWAPLHIASYRRHTCVVEVLLEHGAKVSTGKGATPLHFACTVDRVENVKALLAKGARADVRNSDGWTALHVASVAGHVGNVTALLDSGAEINVKTADPGEGTPLHLASQRGRLEVVKVLLARGAHVDARSVLGVTPLHLAALMGYHLVSEVLLDHGADCNAREMDSWTPLNMACVQGHEKSRSLFVQRGMETIDGRTALQLAISTSHTDIAAVLKPRSPPKPVGASNGRKLPPPAVCWNGGIHNSHAGISQSDPLPADTGVKSCRCTSETADSRSPACVATSSFVSESRRTNAKIHRGKPAVPPKPPRNSTTGPTLHASCESGDADRVSELLATGANPLSRDARGETPLHVACRTGNMEIIQILLIHDRSAVSVVNSSGQTPMDLAISGGHTDLANLLLDLNLQ